MKWIADVRRVTGATRHYYSRAGSDGIQRNREIRGAERVEIRILAEGGVLLVHLDALGNETADTWHESLEMAKRQAAFEFDVADTDWVMDG